MSSFNGYHRELISSLLAADRRSAFRAVRAALDIADSPDSVLEHLVVPCLAAMGSGWDDGSVSLTQVYMGGRIAEELVSELLPKPTQTAAPWGKVLIGTLSDHHGMGQRIVSTFMTVSGAQVTSLGLGVSPEDFVQHAADAGCDIIAVSVLMYRSALQVQELRQMLDARALKTPILVGGAPFNFDRGLWREVGASAMGGNPAEGIAAAKRLLEGRQ